MGDMILAMGSGIAPRSRGEIEDAPVVEEVDDSPPQSVAKSFHATISEDRTDQEALEAQRLVALQVKPELIDPLEAEIRGREFEITV